MIFRDLKKLNNEKGMSIIYALMYMLILTVLGTLTLTAASGTVGRAEKNQTEQSEYFLVRSAADMLRAELEDSAVIMSYKEESYVVETITKSTVDGVTTEESSVESQGPFYMDDIRYNVSDAQSDKRLNLLYRDDISDELQEIYKSLLPEGSEYYSRKTKPGADPSSSRTPITFAMTSTWNSADSIVQGNISIDSNYNMIIKLWTQSEDGLAYRMKLIVDADISQYDDDTTVNVTGDSTETWTERVTTYSTRRNTAVKWRDVQISKDY